MTPKYRLYSAQVRRETLRRGQTLGQRFGPQYALDALAWVVALLLADLLRYDFVTSRRAWLDVLVVCVAAAIIQLIVGWAFALYRGRFVYGTFDEAMTLFFVVLIVALICAVPVFVFGAEVHMPRGLVVIALPIAFVLMTAVRYLKRFYVERTLRPAEGAERTLVYGAGRMGDTLIRSMLSDQHAPLLPVGIVDDDPRLRNRRIRGVPVLGSGQDLQSIADGTGATVLIVAIARADAALLRRITDQATAAELRVKVLPTFAEILEGRSTVSDVRDVAIEDLIGRHPVDLDLAPIAHYLTGKRVLVTGAGGSIGSELCRQVAKFSPAELMMLDRDETGLQTTELSIFNNGLLNTREVVLADIRDAEAIGRIFADRRPEVVFHAAALKHLPLLEQYPEEAWKTNVLGTYNVLRAALDVKVTTFVNVSTDKAANPISVLGLSKRITERLTAWAAEVSGMSYLSVRFGNVIGSRGSVLPTFQALVSSDQPLTVTHPEMTRFFMTIPEACQLVVQAGGIGEPGEVLILDMGEPVRIVDIARRIIAVSGKKLDIVFTGLRDGEKLHEELIGAGESDERPKHPKISHAKVAPISREELSLAEWRQIVTERHADVAAPFRTFTAGRAS